MKIKVCGMSNATQNQAILHSDQVDFLGTIQFSQSPRYFPKELNTSIPTIGVFVNETLDAIVSKSEAFNLAGIQLHGNESPALCSSLPKHLIVIKAFAIGEISDFEKTAAYEGHVDYFLFDTATTTYGGSGRKFNWDLLEHYTGKTPFFLSGGIAPEDIDVLSQLKHDRMNGVDINSRFELEPSIKDSTAVLTFIQQLKS